MKGFNKTDGHPFEEPFISMHLEDAENGDFEARQWLKSNVKEALKEGRPVDPHVRLSLEEMKKGGLRKSAQIKGRGKRGAALGEHNQLRQAAEMFKHIRISGCTVRQAEQNVASRLNCSESSARNAYYNHTGNAQNEKDLFVQLAMDCIDNPNHELEKLLIDRKSGST